MQLRKLSDPLKIEDSVIAYAELQLGMQRNHPLHAVHRACASWVCRPHPRTSSTARPPSLARLTSTLNALEFTALAGEAEALAYTTAPGTEMWAIVGGEEDPNTPGSLLAGSETCKSSLKVNEALIEQVEIREGDTYTVCDAVGSPVDTTVHQIHLSLKSSNKPDFTFYEWHPQAKYRFNRECNLCTDALDDTMAVAYMGDNNYVLSTAQFAATLAVVQGL